MTLQHRFIPYSPIERHAMTGDRRTATLIAADGTIDWLCLPAYDGTIVLGALLDADRGGFFRLGPATVATGVQQYIDETAAVITRWSNENADLELVDLMPWPDDDRAVHTRSRHAILRRLRCTRGTADCVLDFEPRRDFGDPFAIATQGNQFLCRAGDIQLTLWASGDLRVEGGTATASFQLGEGEEFCVALEYGEAESAWSCREVDRAIEEALVYWRTWVERLTYDGPRRSEIRRSALMVHLLSYAPTGSMVAAPTTSLPERVGGERNYDYRFAWVRDASLSMAALALVGDTSAAQRYMDWLASLESATDSPLQVIYRIDGDADVTQSERADLAGYRESRPVRFGNHAALQRQLDSLGYLADCALIYLGAGGAWQDSYWDMIRRTAEYTVANWRLPDSGIWELPQIQHYVSSKVMSWVTLERSIRIAHQTGHSDETGGWHSTVDAIHAEVMDRGWSKRLSAFRQRYEADSLDASALLIPVMGFLPADHPHVVATVRAIEASLMIDEFVHRFRAADTPDHGDLPLGEFEGAFLPCTFWLATTYARMGRTEDAERLLAAAERIAGDLGVFAEEVDARSGTFLGNTPLLFSQVEYVRAILELGMRS